MSDLKVIFPSPEPVRVHKWDAAIYPVKLCDFELFSEVTAGLLKLLTEPSVSEFSEFGGAKGRKLREFIRKTTSLNRYQVWRLPVSSAVQLAAYSMQVNQGFFVKALPEMVAAIQVGLSQSSD